MCVCMLGEAGTVGSSFVQRHLQCMLAGSLSQTGGMYMDICVFEITYVPRCIHNTHTHTLPELIAVGL